MTRVLHILATADPVSGGPIEGAIRCGLAWDADGHRQDLLTLDPPGADHWPDYPGRIINLGEGRRGLLGRYRFSRGARSWLRGHAGDYDAVIVSGLWNFSTMAARLALVGLPVPYFVFTHGMLDPWFKRTYPLKGVAKQLLWLFNEGVLLRHATRVLFTTEEERALAERVFLPYRVKAAVVGYGASDMPEGDRRQRAAFDAAFPAVQGRRFLLFLSRLHAKKGCDLLIGAFARIAAAHPDLDLVIAGPDDGHTEAGLRQQVRALGLGQRVHFTGMIGGDLKWGAFRRCEAFALTSHQENFGVAVVEAMAASRPVLITDKVNIWREVEQDGAGLVDNDTADGAERLLRRFLAMDEGERARMGAAARGSFERRFRADAAAATLMATIQPLARKPAAS